MGHRERGILLLQFCEHPDVLDRDDGLVGERLPELDLAGCERPRPEPGGRDQSNRLAFTERGHGKVGPPAAYPCDLAERSTLLSLYVLDHPHLTGTDRFGKGLLALREH